ncbi:hypothetical protein C0992_002381, partial [Termitomyces sp. T32_za158]
MSSFSARAPPFLVSPAILATQAYVPKIDTFFSFLANVSLEADQRTIVGAMKIFKKWLKHCSKAPEYAEHVGEVWLAPFKANFALAPSLLEDQLADLLGNKGESLLLEAESGGLMVSESPFAKVNVYIWPLVKLDLDWQAAIWAEAAEQRSVELTVEQEEVLMQDGVNASELVAAETVKSTMVAEGSDYEGGSSGNSNKDEEEDNEEIPQTSKRSKTVGSGILLPAVEKRATKLVTPSKRCADKIIPSYTLPAKTTFFDIQLHNLLALHCDDIMLDTNQGAGELVRGIKAKKTASAKAWQQFKLHKGVCDKCWADNNPEACWFPTAALPCYQCNALKRACTYSGIKSCKRSKVDLIMQHTFERSIQVRQACKFVEAQRTQARLGGAVTVGAEGSGSGTQDKSKDKSKGKATAPLHKRRASASGTTTSREPIAPSPGPSRQRPSVPPMASLPLPSDQDKEEVEDLSNSLPIAPEGRHAAPLV